jgi:hypothetical protein
LTLSRDGQEIGAYRNSSVREGDIAIHCHTGSVIEKLEYLDLSRGASAPAEPPVPAAAEVWVDALAEKKLKSPVVVSPNGNGPLFGPGAHRDLAIRATVSGPGEGGRQLFLRASGPTQEDRYVAGWGRDVKAIIQLFQKGQPHKILAVRDLPAGFDLDARHTAEFRVQGSTFILSIDGREAVRAEDSTLANGTHAYYGGPPGSLLETLEYRVLDNPSSAASQP